MSTSRAIKPKRDDTLLSNWESMPERAPSVERADRPTVARIFAMIGLFLVVLGGLNLFNMTLKWLPVVVGPGWAIFLFSIGVSFSCFTPSSIKDFQFRRLYSVVGLALQCWAG